MNLELNKKYLISTDGWFFGPDGRQYRGVHGTVTGIMDADATLGLKTNRNSTNWYVQCGKVLLAGCQVHYVVQCDDPPPEKVSDQRVVDGKVFDVFMKSEVLVTD